MSCSVVCSLPRLKWEDWVRGYFSQYGGFWTGERNENNGDECGDESRNESICEHRDESGDESGDGSGEEMGVGMRL